MVSRRGIEGREEADGMKWTASRQEGSSSQEDSSRQWAANRKKRAAVER
jgi:hypothetical protein